MMFKRIVFASLAAMALATSSGCCGPCGGICNWYPGKFLGALFCCPGCGGNMWYGGCCDTCGYVGGGYDGGGYGGGYDGGGGCGCTSGGYGGEIGTPYYQGYQGYQGQGGLEPMPRPPADTGATRNARSPGNSIRQTGYTAGNVVPQRPGQCACHPYQR